MSNDERVQVFVNGQRRKLMTREEYFWSKVMSDKLRRNAANWNGKSFSNKCSVVVDLVNPAGRYMTKGSAKSTQKRRRK